MASPFLLTSNRDLHPGNILVTEEDTSEEDKAKGWTSYKVLLCDLGEGKMVGNQAVGSTPGKLYTPKRYRAPELDQGKPYTLKCDIYSFGTIVYELLKLAAEKGQSASKVPTKLLELYERCTRADPARRPENISDIVFELERLHDDEYLEKKMEFEDFFAFEEELQRHRQEKEYQKVVDESWVDPSPKDWSS